VIDKFNNWNYDVDAQGWIVCMGYEISTIESVKAYKIKGSYKSDVQVKVYVIIKIYAQEDIQNIQVKLVSNENGFNQIDKRRIDKYVKLWNIPDNITYILKLFTGEIAHNQIGAKDKRRLFLHEMSEADQNQIVKFFNDNKILIVADILKGRGQFSVDWVLVICKIEDHTYKWVLQSINHVMNFFGNGEITITKAGNLKIGRIGVQRKGGDNGRDTANMLQFKIDPMALFND
jgi:hypothetical protein